MNIENKYVKAVSKAYENNELDLLLGCSEKYCLDENGKYYMREDIRLSGTEPENSDPVNFGALLSAVESYYCSLDRKSGKKKQFIDSLTEAIIKLAESGNAEQIYFAARIYFIVAERENQEGYFYPLEGLYKNLKSSIETKVLMAEKELKSINKYAGRLHEEGLWAVIQLDNSSSAKDAKLRGISLDVR